MIIHNPLDAFEELPRGSRIYIWGAGDFGRLLRKRLNGIRSDIRILGFIDSIKDGTLDGLEIYPPRFLTSSSAGFDCVLIASLYHNEIENQLGGMGITDFIIVENGSQLHQMYMSEDIVNYEERLKQAERLLHFEEDRELYRLLIQHRRVDSTDIDGFKKLRRPLENQYLDFIVWNRIHTAVEGGVYDGREIYKYLPLLPKNAVVHGFEPFYRGYLNGPFYRDSLKNRTNVHVYPLALWKTKSRATFVEDRYCSHIIDDRPGDANNNDVTQVDTVALDQWVNENRVPSVDFIKLDVEGAEMEVLAGAVNTLRRYRPQLAISIYHSKEDMFRIPLYLDSILDNYRYRLAHYTPKVIETVWFALPSEIE